MKLATLPVLFALVLVPILGWPAPNAAAQDAQAERASVKAAEPDAPTAPAEEAAAAGGSPQPVPDPGPTQGSHQPILGAFGIPLGERFAPELVARVLGEEEHGYRGADGAMHRGRRYRVEPKITDPSFTSYAVETTSDGRIYAIRGELEAPDRVSKCEVTKTIAASLEQTYGRPRGKGAFGEWYSFRDMTVPEYRGIRLYANRCRRGHYSIVYTDDNVRLAPAESGEAAPNPPGSAPGL